MDHDGRLGLSDWDDLGEESQRSMVCTWLWILFYFSHKSGTAELPPWRPLIHSVLFTTCNILIWNEGLALICDFGIYSESRSRELHNIQDHSLHCALSRYTNKKFKIPGHDVFPPPNTTSTGGTKVDQVRQIYPILSGNQEDELHH